MSRDHQVGKGIKYVECAICAKTVRESDTVEQRGKLVGPECYDDPGNLDNDGDR